MNRYYHNQGLSSYKMNYSNLLFIESRVGIEVLENVLSPTTFKGNF